jgi:hypothetical protein
MKNSTLKKFRYFLGEGVKDLGIVVTGAGIVKSDVFFIVFGGLIWVVGIWQKMNYAEE